MTPEALKLRADNNLAQLPPQEREIVSWILNAGADDMQRRLKAMTGTAADRRVLEVAFDLETAGAKRSTRVKPISAAMKRFTAAPASASDEPPAPQWLAKPKAIDGKATVVPDIDLPTIRQALEAERDHLIEVERSFKHFELDRCLAMGLQVLKAHSVFAVADASERGAMGGRGKSSSTVDEVSEPASFDGWLAKEVSWLPKGSAYRYKRAVQGLGLTHEASPDELAAVLQAARAEAGDKPLSLTQLANRVPLTLTTAEEENTPEDKAGEARTQVHDWISRWDRHEKTGGLEDADVPTLKQLDEFLSNTLQRIRQRIKSAAPAKKTPKPKAAKPTAKKAAKKAAKKKPKAAKS